MKQSLLMSNDLDDIEALQGELNQQGISPYDLKVLSDEETAVSEHHLESINSFNKTDIIRGTITGMFVGLILFSIILTVPNYMELDSPVGVTLFLFIGLIVLGISTWEGGLWGIQNFNRRFKSLEYKIHHGNHLVIINYCKQHEEKLNTAIHHHKGMAAVKT
jgi:hypothetical protein